MDLSKLGIVARTRSPWEAIDLGVTLTKAWWRPLFLSWFIPAAAIFLLSSLIFHQYSWAGCTLVWWLKPALDRGTLYIASRRLFGDNVNARDLLGNVSSVYRRDWFRSLTVRRLSLTRSFDMPLSVLEQVSGKVRSNRQAVLHPSVSSVASWLTIICMHVEMFIVFGINVLLVGMIPEQADINFLNMLLEQETVVKWANSICIFLAMCIIGPFYSVAGFILYISRRIDLEAWDIEIRFRHLAAEQKNKRKVTQASTSSFMTFICTLIVSFSLFIPAPITRADDFLSTDTRTITDEAALAKEDIIHVKLGEDFHQIEQVSGWRLKDSGWRLKDSGWHLKDSEDKQDEKEIPNWINNVSDFLSNNSELSQEEDEIIQTPSAYIKYVLWGLAIVLIIYIIFQYRLLIRNLAPTLITENRPETIPDVMFGLDVRQKSIPENVAAAVHNLWIKKEYRDAVSLLYRSSLAELIHYHELDFSASDTEGECLRKVQEKGEESLSQFCSKLTVLWQSLAYGHQLPEENAVRELCEQWDEVLKRD